ncbi:MAG: cytidine deaminase [Verrucomicrobiota bacterium]
MAAWEAREMAYAGYSNFPVGAAIQTKSGQIFKGCNIENVSYGLTICAERAALATAIQHGERDLVAIAIVSASATPIVPCGACRQVLAEFNPNLTIFSEGFDRNTLDWNLIHLLPMAALGIISQRN